MEIRDSQCNAARYNMIVMMMIIMIMIMIMMIMIVVLLLKMVTFTAMVNKRIVKRFCNGCCTKQRSLQLATIDATFSDKHYACTKRTIELQDAKIHVAG